MGHTYSKPTLIHAGKWLNLFKHKSGWEFVSRKKIPFCESNIIDDAVVIIPIFIQKDHTIELCVIEEWREPMQEYVYGFPAGLVEGNEHIKEAVNREIREEIGITKTHLLHVTPPLWSSEGLTDESVSVCYVLCEGKPHTNFSSEDEDIKIHMIDRETAKLAMDPNGTTLAHCGWGKIAYFVMQDFVNTGFEWLLKCRSQLS